MEGSTIDYFVASAEYFSAVKSLHVLDEAIAQITTLCFCTLLTKCRVTHTFAPYLQHQIPELDMMLRRLKRIKGVLQLSCSNILFH